MDVHIPPWAIKIIFIFPEVAIMIAMSTLLKKPLGGIKKRDWTGFIGASILLIWAGAFNDIAGVIIAGFKTIFN